MRESGQWHAFLAGNGQNGCYPLLGKMDRATVCLREDTRFERPQRYTKGVFAGILLV